MGLDRCGRETVYAGRAERGTSAAGEAVRRPGGGRETGHLDRPRHEWSIGRGEARAKRLLFEMQVI